MQVKTHCLCLLLRNVLAWFVLKKKKWICFLMNIKFRLKIYLTIFLQIAQIRFVNNDQSVILKQGILEPTSLVSLLHEFESFLSVACKIRSSQCSLSDLGKRLNCELKRVVVKTDQTFYIVWYKDALLGTFGPQHYLDLECLELRCLEYLHLVMFVWCPVSLHKFLCSVH